MLILILPLLLALVGCRPPLKLTYYLAGMGEDIHVRSPQFPIATFKGHGSWEVSVVARHVPVGEDSARETRRVYSPDGDNLKILLEDFLPEDGAPVEGPFTFTFAFLGVQTAPILPPCTVTLDQTPPSLFRLVAKPGGGEQRVELTDKADAFVHSEGRIKIQVDDLSPCRVLINGAQAIPYEDGLFLVPLPTEPAGGLEINATDAAGNQQLVTQTIRVDHKDPVIELPGRNQSVVFEKEIALDFTVTDDLAVALVVCRLNNEEIPTAPLPEGRYRVSADLRSGWNEVVFEAFDRAGRHSLKKHRVEYDPSMTRVVGNITGAESPTHTKDPLTTVASFEGPEGQEIIAEASLLEPGQSTPKVITRSFRVKNRKLQIRLRDFSEAKKPITDGQFSINYSTPATETAEEFPHGVVYLDREQPTILLKAMDAHGNEIESPVDGKAEVFVSDRNFKVHVVDESAPRLSINGVDSVFNDNGIYMVPVDPAAVELTATDLAGNSTTALLQILQDNQMPSIYGINGDDTVEDKEFELEFHASDDTGVVGVEVTLNGKPAAITGRDGDLYRASLSLQRGANEVVIKAWDKAWKKITESRTLTRVELTASDEIVILRDGKKHILLMRGETGKSEKWALPGSVMKIEPWPPVKNRFTVTTTSDPLVPMLLIRGGVFPLQGNEGTKQKEPPFLVEGYEVSVKRFSKFQGKQGSAEWIRRLPVEFRDPDQPAVVVDWEEAASFARWAGKKLPTARQHSLASAWDGKRYRRYPWGDAFAAGGLPTDWQPYPPKVTVATGDISPWGVTGLAGGVREWCRDKAPHKASHRILRGGSQVHPRGNWLKAQKLTPTQFLSTRESTVVKSSKMNDVGFRCVLQLSRIPREKIAGGHKKPSGQ